MKFLLISVLLFISAIAAAEVVGFTFEAKVKSFTEKEAVVEAQGRTLTVKRSAIQEKKFVSGDAVHVKLTGADLGSAKTKTK